jgi:hypothetical protein
MAVETMVVNELVLICVSEYAYTQNYITLSSYRLAWLPGGFQI